MVCTVVVINFDNIFRKIVVQLNVHYIYSFITSGIIHTRRGVCCFRELFALAHEYFYVRVNQLCFWNSSVVKPCKSGGVPPDKI